jgi:hypothetical protein
MAELKNRLELQNEALLAQIELLKAQRTVK